MSLSPTKRRREGYALTATLSNTKNASRSNKTTETTDEIHASSSFVAVVPVETQPPDRLSVVCGP